MIQLDKTFQYYTLCTRFYYNLITKVKDPGSTIYQTVFDSNLPKRMACFRDLFMHLGHYKKNTKISAAIEIFMCKDVKNILFNKFNNYVITSEDNVIRHIEKARSIVPFDYTLSTVTATEDILDWYKVRINITGNSIQIKFVCAWIRYLYEYPANLLINDLYDLKDRGKFQEDSIINLIMACSNTLTIPGHRIRYDQCVHLYGKFLTDGELARRLGKGNAYLSNIYTPISQRRYDSWENSLPISPITDEQDKVMSVNWWNNKISRYVFRYRAYKKAVDYFKENS